MSKYATPELGVAAATVPVIAESPEAALANASVIAHVIAPKVLQADGAVVTPTKVPPPLTVLVVVPAQIT